MLKDSWCSDPARWDERKRLVDGRASALSRATLRLSPNEDAAVIKLVKTSSKEAATRKRRMKTVLGILPALE